jgi:hypothetical protein
VTENTTWRNRRSGELPALLFMQRIFSSFIPAQERASRLTPNYPQIFSLFFRHYLYQAARVAEESFRAHSRRCSNGQTRTTAAAQQRTRGRRRGAAFSMRAAEPARRAGAATPPLLVQRESCGRDATAGPLGRPVPTARSARSRAAVSGKRAREARSEAPLHGRRGLRCQLRLGAG